jgi:hypothetical protein
MSALVGLPDSIPFAKISSTYSEPSAPNTMSMMFVSPARRVNGRRAGIGRYTIDARAADGNRESGHVSDIERV